MREEVQSLDIRDIAIINAFPLTKSDVVLNVGCGKGRLDHHLLDIGFNVISTDIKKCELVSDTIKFNESDIFDLSTFPVKSADVVICSEVLEHLEDYTTAFFNLLTLAEHRLIITVPYKRSFIASDHIHFWDDDLSEGKGFIDIEDFIDLAAPFSTSISKIITKIEDIQLKQRCYLMIIDKTQIG